jgi:hypothetical protein
LRFCLRSARLKTRAEWRLAATRTASAGHSLAAQHIGMPQLHMGTYAQSNPTTEIETGNKDPGWVNFQAC